MPADLLSSDLHNCQSISNSSRQHNTDSNRNERGTNHDSKHNINNNIVIPAADDYSISSSSGRIFAVLKKRPISGITPSHSSSSSSCMGLEGRGGGSLSSPSSVGALIGVCVDSIDENASLNDLINNCISSNTVSVNR